MEKVNQINKVQEQHVASFRDTVEKQKREKNSTEAVVKVIKQEESLVSDTVEKKKCMYN